jgi:hypothetical protein
MTIPGHARNCHAGTTRHVRGMGRTPRACDRENVAMTTCCCSAFFTRRAPNILATIENVRKPALWLPLLFCFLLRKKKERSHINGSAADMNADTLPKPSNPKNVSVTCRNKPSVPASWTRGKKFACGT